MAGRKRSSSDAGMATRSAGSKTAKTESSSKPASKAEKSKKPASTKGAKRGPKAPAAGSFKTRALPLHVNVTHTPPAIPDKDTENASTADPGHLGSLALVPSTFSTGSYGWKGTKRFTVELEDPESADGKTEKVHVMLTINATVVGSKDAEKEGEEKVEEDAPAEETAEAEE